MLVRILIHLFLVYNRIEKESQQAYNHQLMHRRIFQLFN